MDIILYLSELLKNRKSVGIAGLGTFYKKKSPGKYDAEQHAFVPPSYTVSFEETVDETEELVQYIASQRNITPDSARYFIEEFAERTHAQLADQHQVELTDLGTLVVEHDQLRFIPSTIDNFSNEFYGLPRLSELKKEEAAEESLAEIEEENKLEEENPGQETTDFSANNLENDEQPVYEEITETSNPIVEKAPVFEPPIIETTEREEIVEEPVVVQSETEEVYFEEEDEPKKGIGFWSKFFIVLALIVAIGAIAYFINPGFFDKYIQNNHQGNPITSIPATDTPKLDSNKIDTSATKAESTPLKDSTVIDSTKTYFEVIGTSESTKQAADNYIKRLSKIGITAKHIKLSKVRFNVSIGTFLDDKQALKYRDSVRVLLKNPGIYIKPIKPKKHTK